MPTNRRTPILICRKYLVQRGRIGKESASTPILTILYGVAIPEIGIGIPENFGFLRVGTERYAETRSADQ